MDGCGILSGAIVLTFGFCNAYADSLAILFLVSILARFDCSISFPKSRNPRVFGKLEMFPETASTRDLVLRHRSRLTGISSSDMTTIPRDGVPEFLLRRAQLDFQTLIQSAGMRKLTDDEVERLKRVQFDFD